MPETPVGAYIHEPLDVYRDLTPEIPFNPVVSLNGSPQPCDLLFSEIPDADVRVNPGVLQDFAGSRTTNTKDVRQRYLKPFFPRKIYPGDTCHTIPLFSSEFIVHGAWIGTQPHDTIAETSFKLFTLNFEPRTIYPCRCLCRGFSHTTRSTLFRRMILHFSHIGFTDARTFMITPTLRNRSLP